jgi:hypothetical protein
MRAPAFCWMMPPSSWPYLSNGTPVGGTSIGCWIHRQKPARLPFAHPRAPPPTPPTQRTAYTAHTAHAAEAHSTRILGAF